MTYLGNVDAVGNVRLPAQLACVQRPNDLAHVLCERSQQLGAVKTPGVSDWHCPPTAALAYSPLSSHGDEPHPALWIGARLCVKDNVDCVRLSVPSSGQVVAVSHPLGVVDAAWKRGERGRNLQHRRSPPHPLHSHDHCRFQHHLCLSWEGGKASVVLGVRAACFRSGRACPSAEARNRPRRFPPLCLDPHIHRRADERSGTHSCSPPRHPARPHPAMANKIREVWAENLDEEMGYLRDTLARYPYVAMVSVHAAPAQPPNSHSLLATGH